MVLLPCEVDDLHRDDTTTFIINMERSVLRLAVV